jgi:hypothetical protein
VAVGVAGWAASGALGGHRRPLSPAPVLGRGTGMITISKVILSGAAPGRCGTRLPALLQLRCAT